MEGDQIASSSRIGGSLGSCHMLQRVRVSIRIAFTGDQYMNQKQTIPFY